MQCNEIAQAALLKDKFATTLLELSRLAKSNNHLALARELSASYIKVVQCQINDSNTRKELIEKLPKIVAKYQDMLTQKVL